MNRVLELWSDGACLALFDREACAGRRSARYPFLANADVREGRVALLSVGQEIFRLRVTDRGLTAAERKRVVASLKTLGVEVRTGRLYLSGMDAPGESPLYLADRGAGAWLEVPAGRYRVEAYALRGRGPDFVLVLRPHRGPFPEVAAEPRLIAQCKSMEGRRARR